MDLKPLSANLKFFSKTRSCPTRVPSRKIAQPIARVPSSAPSPYIIGILPARWGSTRFPGKPLHLIAGKPLIQHVWERCQECSNLEEIVVATDDQRIFDAVAA